MKANADMCHVLLSTSNELTVKINEVHIKNSKSENLLGITTDNDLKFEYHTNNICRIASTKISALSRIAPYMDLPKRKQIMNAFFKSQFSYSPLTWMMYSRKLNDKIKRLHEICLRITYNDSLSSFEELLERDNSVSVHNGNIQYLAIELCKVFNGICPDIMKDVFPLSTSSNYDIRSRGIFTTSSVTTVYCGTKSLSHLVPKVWELISNNIKSLENLPKFKKVVKNWKPDVCPCRLCRLYISQVGFFCSGCSFNFHFYIY